MGRALGLLLAIVAWGCGDESYIILEIDSGLTIPSQIDRLDILHSDGNGAIVTNTVALEAAATFPVTVLFEPKKPVPQEVYVRVEGYLGTMLVADQTGQYAWKSGVRNQVPITLTPR